MRACSPCLLLPLLWTSTPAAAQDVGPLQGVEEDPRAAGLFAAFPELDTAPTLELRAALAADPNTQSALFAVSDALASNGPQADLALLAEPLIAGLDPEGVDQTVDVILRDYADTHLLDPADPRSVIALVVDLDDAGWTLETALGTPRIRKRSSHVTLILDTKEELN